MEGQMTIFDFIKEAEEAPQFDVPIEGVVNLKTSPISDYKVKMSYGDLTLIVAMLRDYVKGLDQMQADGDLRINSFQYEAYYRNKFLQIAERISEQIEYDYDSKLKQCLKRAGKEDNSDIGEESMALMIKRANAAAEAKRAAESEEQKC